MEVSVEAGVTEARRGRTVLYGYRGERDLRGLSELISLFM